MDFAINSKTNEIISALGVEENLSYQFIEQETWFADPNDILSYDPNKVKDIAKIEVKFRKGSEKIVNKFGTEYFRTPCWFIPNKEELGINTIPESKEHKLCKNWIYSKIKNKDLKFKYSSVISPYNIDNIVSLKELDIDYNKIGIEVIVKNNRRQRADIIIPFKKIHSFLGIGIVIEIQFSNQRDETTQHRSLEWALKGYSISWLFFKDFEEIEEDFVSLKEDTILLNINEKILYDYKETFEYDLRYLSQEFSRKVDEKMRELNYPFYIGECKICNKGYMTKKVSKKNGNEFYSCSNWRNGCNHTISL